MISIINQQDFATTQWSGGSTRQIFISPAGSKVAARDFDVRISSAVINVTHSTFSDFSGFQRVIMPVEGNITLLHNGNEVTLSHDEPFRFSGDDAVESVNTPGAVDFNVIYRNCRPEVWIEHESCLLDTTDLAVLFALGECTVNGQLLHKHCAAIVRDEPVALTGCAVIVALYDLQ